MWTRTVAASASGLKTAEWLPSTFIIWMLMLPIDSSCTWITDHNRFIRQFSNNIVIIWYLGLIIVMYRFHRQGISIQNVWGCLGNGLEVLVNQAIWTAADFKVVDAIEHCWHWIQTAKLQQFLQLLQWIYQNVQRFGCKTSVLRVIMLDRLEDLLSLKYFPEPSKVPIFSSVSFKDASILRKSNLSIVLLIILE